MGGRSRNELEEIRKVNRQSLGMADYPGPAVTRTNAVGPYTGHMAYGVPGMGASPFSLAPDVRIVTAFPRVDRTFSPGSSQPVVQQDGGGWLTDWITSRIVRPEVYVGPIRIAPYDSYPNLSGLAEIVAIVVGTIGGMFGAWVLWRAFGPRGGA